MDLDKVLNKKFAPIEQTITEKDCMLYALGIGLGRDALARAQLQFVYEKGLCVFPSMAVVIASPMGWLTEPSLGVDYVQLLHGEQAIIQHRPLLPNKTYIGQFRVLGVADKGADKGAIVYQEKTLTEKESGALVSTVTASHFLRGDGGCGGDYVPPASSVQAAPVGEKPAKSVRIGTDANTALIYRLSGDYNPLHADPEVAARAGFERPILHGLCSFGIAARAVLDAYGGSDASALVELGLRFSAPVYPGELIEVDMWEVADGVAFTAKVSERGVKVLNRGWARLK